MTMIRIEMQTKAGLDEKGSPNLLFVGVLISTAILEVILEVSQKTRNRTAKWFSYIIPGQILTGLYILPQRHLHILVYCSSIHKVQEVESTKMPINWWTDKGNVVHEHNEYYSAVKKKETMKFPSKWMKLEKNYTV